MQAFLTDGCHLRCSGLGDSQSNGRDILSIEVSAGSILLYQSLNLVSVPEGTAMRCLGHLWPFLVKMASILHQEQTPLSRCQCGYNMALI